MPRNEQQTCREIIEPALNQAGWEFDREVEIGPGKVNLSGEQMYDPTQKIVADYVLRLSRMPLAILEAKAEHKPAADGMQQGSRYAQRLGLRFSIASNGQEYILTDNHTGAYQRLTQVPTPWEILDRLGRSNIDWDAWQPVFEYPWYEDQITRRRVRPYQEMAIFETLYRFSQGMTRVLLLMATGTGKTFTIFQLAWKLLHGNVLQNNRILFVTDRNSLKDQAYRAFAGFASDERVVIDKNTVRRNQHQVGKLFFANYQNLDEELNDKKIYEYFEPDFFDLVVVDECHRSGFGDWFGVLKYFGSAYQLGLTATPREIDDSGRPLTEEEQRRDTYNYFGEPAYTYSLKQAIEDGYLVPYLLEERISNVDANGYTGPDGKRYTTNNFEREIRLPDRTRFIAEDLWQILGRYGLRQEKTIVFCVDDTHAAFMAQELRRISGDNNYAARITRSERNSHQLERNFAEIGSGNPRVAVTVDLLTTGFDAPDVKNIVFARPLKSSILYKQMKGRGTRLCEDIDKRYFTLFDYAGASQLEDSEFDGHPANTQKPKSKSKSSSGSGSTHRAEDTTPKPVAEGVSVILSNTERYVCLADGRKIPFDDYCEQSKEIIRSISSATLDELLQIWIDQSSRKELYEELKDRDIYISAFQHYLDLDHTDGVDILAKVGFDLVKVPTRHDRVVRFWDQEEYWLMNQVDEQDIPEEEQLKSRFWQASLDHYALFGIDDLERGATYSAPQFVALFGNFSSMLRRYGGASALRNDLEAVKHHLYVPMVA
ncbi:DEAD/DEAH box helicase family protein [Calothrix sp. FACHB-1219]|uniref:DEAD/DEAH box helicase family protein n=1 Tax=unclassified Calothrix TaxID=2619626 RepID=UPI0016864A2F|nr:MULTISPECIES: DEAD/DEAH box helicase family protein [unclassified Calothrix]MBD2206881.1 DEAD/DEAH box helicase family protein [Calothrix sp. FACHB-168]MBD2221499.1 DEAD/DEAH box helicase family protein [Calothrix sp. FACHB-1219]